MNQNVVTTQDARTDETGIVIPAGTVGQIRAQVDGQWWVHFRGVFQLIKFPVETNVLKAIEENVNPGR